MVSVLIMGCAQISSPTGGAVDDTPPVITNSTPENESVHFVGDVITIEFDEYIQLNDIHNQLIVSPPLAEKPTVTVKKKTVVVELNSELQENTTYALNFGEGIKDYNAGNILRNYTYAFSTGAELDSLSFTGNVQDAFLMQPKENVKVMLYPVSDDSLFLSHKPVYFSQTDEAGNFEIKYLPMGDYQIRALDEVDGNFLYDNPEENIAFLKETITVTADTGMATPLTLRMFNEELERGYITKSKKASKGIYKVAFNKKQQGIEAFQVVDNVEIALQSKYEKDTLTFFTHDLGDVYLKRFGMSNDTNEPSLDTLFLSDFTESIKEEEYPFIIKLDSRSILPNALPKFSTNAPLKDISNSKIEVKLDSLVLENVELIQTSSFELNLNGDFLSGQNYTGLLTPGAVLSDYSAENDSVSFRFQILDSDELGELHFVFNDSLQNRLFVLEDKSGTEIVKTPVFGVDILLTNLMPSSLKVYYVVDEDESGDWTSGNYTRMLQPEEIKRLKTPIDVRANWSLEFVWD